MEVNELPAYVFKQLVVEPQAVPDVLGEAHIGQCHESGDLAAWLRLSTAGPVVTLGLYASGPTARQARLERPALLSIEAGFSDSPVCVIDKNIGSHALRIISYETRPVTDREYFIRREIGSVILRQTLRAASRIQDIRFVRSHVDSLSARSCDS